MRWLLAGRNRRVLAGLAPRRALLAFDFDGTLAPIVADRDRARLSPRTRRRLQALTRRFRCAVVSGRSRADLARRCAGIRLAALVGNHGAEGPWPGGGAATRRAVARWRDALRRRLGDGRGIEIEDKGWSLAIHFRRSPSRPGAARVIWSALRSLAGARTVAGNLVVNVLPAGSPDKGRAIARLSALLARETVLYVGDDDTDEDVFASGLPGLVSVRVGRHRGSRARYFLRSRSEVDELLAALARLPGRPAGAARVDGSRPRDAP
jgi:trehalose 6-phosphate phosphatase